MAALFVDGLFGADLYHVAKIHDHDPVAEMLDDPQVVGDEHIGQVVLLLDVLHQIDDLGLDGYVQGGHGLVTDHKLGVQGNGPGNAHPLPLAAGELVGVAVDVLRPQADPVHQLTDLGKDLLPAHLRVMDLEGLRQDLVNGLSGVQRGVGILENDLHLAADGAHILAAQGRQLRALEGDRAGSGLDQVQHQPPGGGLAAAGLTHHTQGLTPENLEGNIVYGLDGLVLVSGGEIFL